MGGTRWAGREADEPGLGRTRQSQPGLLGVSDGNRVVIIPLLSFTQCMIPNKAIFSFYNSRQLENFLFSQAGSLHF